MTRPCMPCTLRGIVRPPEAEWFLLSRRGVMTPLCAPCSTTWAIWPEAGLMTREEAEAHCAVQEVLGS